MPILPMMAWVAMLVFGTGMAAPTSRDPPYSSGEEDSYKSCTSDVECDAGFFCYKNSPDPEFHYCARCIDCNDHRRQPGWVSCVKSEDACGPCLPGFVTRGRHCGHPENDVELEQMRSSGSSGSKVPGVYIGVISGLATTILVLGAVMTSLLYKYGALNFRRPIRVPTESKTEEGETDLSDAETEVLSGSGTSRNVNSIPSAPVKALLDHAHAPPPPYYATDSSDSGTAIGAQAGAPYRGRLLTDGPSRCYSQASVSSTSRRKINERHARAGPYSSGRGAGRRTVAIVGAGDSRLSVEEAQALADLARNATQMAQDHNESMEYDESLESNDPGSLSEDSYMDLDLPNPGGVLPAEEPEPVGVLEAAVAAENAQPDLGDLLPNDDVIVMEMDADLDLDFMMFRRISPPVPSPSTSEDEAKAQEVPNFSQNGS